MTTNLDNAMARLRAADPATTADPKDAGARAMFERIAVSTEQEPVRKRSPRRRLALAGVAAAVVAGSAVAGVVATPWSHGHPADAAFAVARHGDGSISVVVRWDQLHNPAALNGRLARLHARTVVIQTSAACRASFAVDPAHNGIFHVDLTKHPELRKPGAPAAWLRTHQPWINYSKDGTRSAFVIHPDKIPAGDTLLISYSFTPTQTNSAEALASRSMLVPRVPRCVETPEHIVYTPQGVHRR